MSLLSSRYEQFVSLSSSLTGTADHLSLIEEWAVMAKEKTGAVLMLVAEAKAEVEGREREREEGEERVRWLRELQLVVERVQLMQQLMQELQEEEDRETERQSERQSSSREGVKNGTSLAWEEKTEEPLRSVQDGVVRAVIRRAVQAAKATDRRDEGSRQQRREDSAARGDAAHEDVEAEEEEDEAYDADEAVKRQHNAAYDLFLSLLALPPAAAAAVSPSPPSDSLLSLLTHLTVLLVSLHASLALTSSFSLVASLQPTVATLSDGFASHLSRALLQSLSSSSQPALSSVLRLYLLLDQQQTAQQIVRDSVVQPALAAIVSPSTLRVGPVSPSSSSPPSNLQSLYRDVLSFAQRLLPLLCSASASFTPSAFDWAGDVFFASLSSALLQLSSSLFSPGTPHVFHFHYSLSQSLLSSLAALAPPSPPHAAFLSHPAVEAFTRKFNLQIYFRLRLQQIAGAVEAQCSRSVDELQQQETAAAAGGAAGGWLQVSDSVRHALLQCWSDGVWLQELSGHFMRLSLQLLERYALMAEHGCRTTSSAPSGAAAEGEAAAQQGVTAVFPTPLLFALYADVQGLLAFLSSSLTPLIVSRLPPEAASASLVTATLAPSVARLSSLPPLLLSTLSSVLSSSVAAGPLASIHRLASTYRIAGSKRPSGPSPYTASLLRSLSSLLSSPSALQRWPVADRQLLLRRVVSSCLLQLQEKAASVLELAVKTEQSLRLLKRKGGAAGAGGGGGGEEVDKMRAQLELDVRELERGLHELGIRELPELHSLLQAVRTAGLSTAASS